MATPKKSAAKKSSGKSRNTLSKQAGITFSAAKVGRIIRNGNYMNRVSAGASVFIAGVLEYLTSETLGLAAKLVKGKERVSPRHILLAVRNDADLGELLSNVTIARGGVQVQDVKKAEKKKKSGKKGGKKGGKKAAAASGEKKAKKSGGKKKSSKKAKSTPAA